MVKEAQDGFKDYSNSLYICTDKMMHPGTFFSGLIDDVRIYNQALSAEEVAALAN